MSKRQGTVELEVDLSDVVLSTQLLNTANRKGITLEDQIRINLAQGMAICGVVIGGGTVEVRHQDGSRHIINNEDITP